MAEYVNVSEENLTNYENERKKPFYVRHKKWVICGGVTLVVLAIFLPILFLVIIPRIIQSIVDHSSIAFTSAALSNVTVSSFRLSGNGSISNAGSIPATITTDAPINLFWNGLPLGSLPGLPPISAGTGSDVALSVNDIVTVSSEDNFANFAAYLLNNQNFTWVLTTTVTVRALGIPFSGISLNKTVTLNAANKFSNVAIQSFDIPGDTTDGRGIALTVNAAITNPSDIDFDLGDVTFSLIYDEQQVGSLVAKAVRLLKGDNVLAMTGSLSTSTTEGLAAVGRLFSNYIKGQASLTRVIGSSASSNNVDIPWLSNSLKSLELVVPLPGRAFTVITAIDLGNTDVDITPETAYSPILTAPSIRASYQLPFPFTAVPLQAGQALTLLNSDGGAIGSLITSLAPVQDSTEPNVILLGVSAPLIASDATNFDSFFASVTNEGSVSFTLKGTVDTVIRTVTGDIPLSGVPVEVPASLSGLNGLRDTPVSISNVVVVGGDQNGISITTDTGLNNPSTSKIILNSDAVFDLYYTGVQIGIVTLPSLTLDRGANTVGATVYYSPSGSAQDAGKAFLAAYVTNQDITVTIRGNYDSTTSIDSLRSAFSQISLDASIPKLNKQIVTGAALSIPENIGQTSIAYSSVTVVNPFAAGLSILSIDSSVVYSGRVIGSINNADLRADPIVVGGTSTVTRAGIPLSLRSGVGDIVWLLETAAAANNVDLGVLQTLLDTLLAITGSSTTASATTSDEDFANSNSPSRTSNVDNIPTKRDLFARQNSDITDVIFRALAGLTVDLSITSTLRVGDYETSISFSQNGVATTVDNTVLRLIGAVGGPLVQYIVDGSSLSFTSTELRDLSDAGFALKTAGKIENTGPLTAQITFPNPVSVSWVQPDGSLLPLGSLPLPDITATPSGADLNTDGRFSISSISNFAQFTGYMLKAPSFTWAISSDSVVVSALENTFTNVRLNKNVTLAGFNGLDQLTITAFDLPSNAAEGGITLNIAATLFNPSAVSIELGTLTFDNYFHDELVGPVTTTTSTFLNANANNALQLSGRITPRTGTADTVALAELFGIYLAGQAATLTVRGNSVTPPNGNYVNWLVPVFKQLELSVSLPGANPVKPLVTSIGINDFALDFTSGAFNPLTTSNNIVAAFLPPFAFPIDVVSVAQELTVVSHGGNIATLSVPFNPATTDLNTNLITTGISAGSGTPPRFTAISGSESAYITFIGETLASQSVSFELKGTLNAYANTGVGRLPLFGLPLDVTTSLVGFNNFGGVVTSVPVPIGDVLLDAITSMATTRVTTIIHSDSPVTVKAGRVVFHIEYTAIGLFNPDIAGQKLTFADAVIDDLTISQGDNTAVANVSFSLTEAFDYLSILFEFIAVFVDGLTLFGVIMPVDIFIVGGEDSTDIPSLQPVFKNIRLSTSIQITLDAGARTSSSLADQFRAAGVPLGSVLPYASRVNGTSTQTLPATTTVSDNAASTVVSAAAEATTTETSIAEDSAGLDLTDTALQAGSGRSSMTNVFASIACAVVGLIAVLAL